jgi:hypothetical protein
MKPCRRTTCFVKNQSCNCRETLVTGLLFSFFFLKGKEVTFLPRSNDLNLLYKASISAWVTANSKKNEEAKGGQGQQHWTAEIRSKDRGIINYKESVHASLQQPFDKAISSSTSNCVRLYDIVWPMAASKG